MCDLKSTSEPEWLVEGITSDVEGGERVTVARPLVTELCDAVTASADKLDEWDWVSVLVCARKYSMELVGMQRPPRPVVLH